MGSLKAIGRAVRVIHQQLGLKRLLQLADPHCGWVVERIEPSDKPLSVVVICPHPDDESIGCGGAIALHNKRGDHVHVIYTTDGGKLPREAQKGTPLAETRMHEAMNALELLGGATIDHLGLQDGKGATPEEAVTTLANILSNKKPSRIYVPWRLDAHPDHQAANTLLGRALEKIELPHDSSIWQYEVWTPLVANRYVPIANVLDEKEAAILAHESQIKQMNLAASSIGLAQFRGVQGGLKGPAEAFFATPADKFAIFSEL